MKEVATFIITLILSVFVTATLFQVFWNDWAVDMFSFPRMSLLHAVEINLSLRLLFQNFEFTNKE